MRLTSDYRDAPSTPPAGEPRGALDEVALLRERVAVLEDAARVATARLTVLGAMTHGLGAVQDVQEACDIALRLLQNLMPSLESLAIYLASRPGMVLERRAAVGPAAWADEGEAAISLRHDTLMSRAFSRNRTHVGHGDACVAAPPPAEDAVPGEGALCCALVPMRAGATVVGVLRVAAAPGEAIEDEDAAFLEVVAAQVAAEVYTLERQAFLQSVVDQSPAGLVVVEAPHGHVVLANRAAHDLWGRRLAPAVQDGVACSLLRAADLGLPPLQHTLQSGVGVGAEECVIVRPDGSPVPVVAGTTLLGMGADHAQYVACTVHDITAVKRVDALKDEFLSIVSHELRTPLTAAKGFVQLGVRRLGTADPAQVRRTFTEADLALSDLTALVEELLEFSRLQAGRFHVDPEPLELCALIERHARPLRVLSERHRIEVHLPSTPVFVEADYRRLGQVICNLIGNAVKYSPRGGTIALTASLHGAEVHVAVRDPGIGVPAEERERIFAPYYRASNTQGRNFGGLGMGLYISRSIVEHHGGRIWLESAAGQGTTISFSVPLLAAAPA